jgi:hypothetical protein
MNNPEKVIYRRKPEVISGKLEDQIVMMDIDKGKYFSMNPVATRVWELLEEPSSAGKLCDQLLNEFEVSREKCFDEVHELLKKMQELDLLEITS